MRLAEAYSNTLSEWVASGDLDIAIVTEPSDYPGLENVRFFPDRMVLVRGPKGRTNGSAATPVKKRKPAPGHWTPAELETLKLVLPSRQQNLRRAIESRIWHGGMASGKILEIDGLTGTVEFVCSSDWATILPVFSVIEDVKAGRLAAESISEPEPWLDYFLAQRKDVALSVASRNFLDMLKAAIERISAEWPLSGSSQRP
jgi:LysR family nitrogen assimilation transcriptional regulator